MLGDPRIRLDDPLAEPDPGPGKPQGTKVPDAPAAPAAPDNPKANTPKTPEGPFSFDQVRSLAADLALKPYVKRAAEIPNFWKDLPPAEAAKISYIPERRLWTEPSFGYQLDFQHPSAMGPSIIQFAEVVSGRSNDLPWQRDSFDYHDLAIPDGTAEPRGYAGCDVLIPLDTGDHYESILKLRNYTGFKGRAPGMDFGVRSAALMINPGTENEELPQFQRIWFDRPTMPNKACNFYALVDSPSLTGAYRFKLIPGTSTTLEVESELYLRQPVKTLALAPMTSLCWFSELTTPKPADYHPEVHNSDGLLVHLSETEAIWRPLDISTATRTSEVQAERFLGFGLVQRDRQFASYQDLDVNYHLCPSAYIRPVGKWPAGTVRLMELPAIDAHEDNVLAFWQPDVQPKVGQPFRFGYLLHWSPDVGAPGLSRVLGSRRSQQIFPADEKRPNLASFVVDFSQSSSLEVDQKQVITAVSVVGGGKLLEKKVQKNPATGGWRAIFHVQIDPATTKLDLNCRLLSDGRPISERWNYQWIK